MAGFDFPCGRRKPLHGLGDALGEIEPHPRGADQNHQRHHQEERQIDAGQRVGAAPEAGCSPRTHPECAARVTRARRSGNRSRSRRRRARSTRRAARPPPRGSARPSSAAVRASAARPGPTPPARPSDRRRRARTRAACPARRRRHTAAPPAAACRGVTRYTSTIFTRPCVTSGRMRSRTAADVGAVERQRPPGRRPAAARRSSRAPADRGSSRSRSDRRPSAPLRPAR